MAEHGYDISSDAYLAPSAAAAFLSHRPINARPKSITFPASRKVNIEMSHILDRHTADGKTYQQSVREVERRGGVRYKDKLYDHMSPKQVEGAVRQAYKNTESPIKVQGDRLLMRGTSKGMEIEFWYNKVTQTIETAYPIGRG